MSSTPRHTPRWRAVVDKVDDVVTPSANKVVRTNAFADLVAATTRLEVQLRRRVQKQTGALWRLLNLPTADDQRSLRAQVAALEARLRDLTERLEDAQSEKARSGGHGPTED